NASRAGIKTPALLVLWRLRILERLDVVDELDFFVHHPDIRRAGVGYEAVGPRHEPDKDGRLLRDQQGREGEPDDDADILCPIPHEHLPGHEIHGICSWGIGQSISAS